VLVLGDGLVVDEELLVSARGWTC